MRMCERYTAVTVTRLSNVFFPSSVADIGFPVLKGYVDRKPERMKCTLYRNLMTYVAATIVDVANKQGAIKNLFPLLRIVMKS